MIEEIRNEINMCATENGDMAYLTTYNANLDLFGVSGALRNNQKELIRLFDSAFAENKTLAIKNMLYLRDVRGGLGERKSFRTAFRRLIDIDPEAAAGMIPLIPEVGRYDDLFVCTGTVIEDQMFAYIEEVLAKDIDDLYEGKDISLLGKWLPSCNASNEKTKTLGRLFARKLGLKENHYRMMLSDLRRGRIIENNLRERNYSFNYSSVPSVAMHKYRAAFTRNDAKRYQDFIKSVNEGKARINASVLYPYQIVSEAYAGMSREEKLAMQVKWDALKSDMKVSKTIVVRDGSGSMTCRTGGTTPLDIATSLAIMFAEKLEGEFHNRFITFSSDPRLVEFKGYDLFSKIVEAYDYCDCSNTNIEKVYDLILSVASRPGFNKEDMIERIVIISDMEFDMGTSRRPTYNVFKEKFESLGLKMPEVIYWNVCARRVHFAALPDNSNIRLVSGSSSSIIDSIISNENLNAEEYMLSVLKKYDYADSFIK